MQGTLFKYGPGSAHVAFKSPATAKHPRCSGQLHLVLVGGLTDGLLFAPYGDKLATAIGNMGWNLVQAQLTSSYQGWGVASLDQDASELRLLSRHLAEQYNCTAWVLMGHSTGCQDAVRYVQRYRAEDNKLAGVILQAPVSDREYLSMYPAWADMVQPAKAMVAAGEGDDVLCRARDFDGAAVTANRFLSLYCAGGDDDMFSTDLTVKQLRSGDDEAVPEALRRNGSVTELGKCMIRAMQTDHSVEQNATFTSNCAAKSAEGGDAVAHKLFEPQLHVIEGAGHACAGHEDDVVQLVCGFLQQLPHTMQR